MVTRELEKSPELLQNLKDLLTAVGEDPERDGLQKTPYRFLKAFDFLTHGYAKDPNALINGALFDAPYSEMVQ